MASILEVYQGTTSIFPGTTWAAPNGLFGATADRNDGSAYGWADSTSTITLPSSGLADGYLFLWGYELHDTSNGRCTIAGRMQQTGGTGNFETAQTGGYCRDNSEDRAYVSGWSFVDNPSASSTFQFQWKRDSDAPTGGTQRAFIQVVPFYYADIGLYSSTTAGNYGGTTPNLMTGFSGTDGTNITISSNQISVTGDNKRYLVLGAAYQEDVSGGTRTQRWYGLEVDGSFDDSSKGCMYYRNGSNDIGGESFIRLLETATATRTIEMNGYRGDGVLAGEGGADVDGTGTESNAAHAMVVIELHDDAEVYSYEYDGLGYGIAIPGPVDSDVATTGGIEFNDAASFTRASDTAINCEQAMDLFAFVNSSQVRGSAGISSGTRFTFFAEFTFNGTENTDVGFHGNYNRGNQSSADTFGSSSNNAGVFAVSSGDDLGYSHTELPGTEGGAGSVNMGAGWFSLGAINLDTLESVGGSSPIQGDTSIAFSQAADLNGTGDLAVATSVAFSQSVTPSATGELQAASSVDFSQSGSIAGTGALLGAESVDFSETATILADGALSVSANVAFSETADLNGIGDLAATVSIDFTASAEAAIDNELFGSTSIDFSETATLVADGALLSSSSIGFSETASVNASGQLQASTSVAFGDAASLAGIADISASTNIAFSESGQLLGAGELQAATSVAWSQSADLNAAVLKDLWAGVAVSPLILPIKPYVFSPPQALQAAASIDFSQSATLTADGALQATASVDFSESGAILAKGQLQAADSIAFGQAALILADGALEGATSIDFGQSATLSIGIQGSTSIAFSESASLRGAGFIQAADSIAFSESAALLGGGDLSASTSIAFSESADLTGDSGANLAAATDIDLSQTATVTATGSLASSEAVAFSVTATVTAEGQLIGSTSVDFSQSADASGLLAAYAVSPLVLPITRYAFEAKSTSLKTNEAIAFTHSATLTGTGGIGGDLIQGSTSIDLFGFAVYLEGRGQLQGATSIAFSDQATLSASLNAQTSITFATSATLTADGALQASESIAFSETAGLTQDVNIQGAVSIDFSESASLTMFGRVQAGESVVFTEASTLTAKGQLAGSTNVAFSESVTGDVFARIKGSAVIQFTNPGSLPRPILGSESIAFTATADLKGIERGIRAAKVTWLGDGSAIVDWQDDATVLMAWQAQASTSMKLQAAGTLQVKQQPSATAIMRF